VAKRKKKVKQRLEIFRRSPRRANVNGGTGESGYLRRYLLRQNQNGYVATFESFQRALARLRIEYNRIGIGTTLSIARQNDNVTIYSVTKTFFGPLEKKKQRPISM
jgi:hypothetical protein